MKGFIQKFTFSDHDLAIKVRSTVYDSLTKYDSNRNGLFEEDQIRTALMQILKQDQNQVKYVVANVFRYDKDRDGCITYDQFTNFSVEQHFGEMAIQRLHRKGYYSNGSRRIMNAEEFANTLSYCLGFINVESSTRFYEKLFSEVDLDYDGFISYEDYFVFLKEYFGSKSYAASQTNIEPPPPKEQKKPEETFVDGNGETNNERFAKLIYSQFKILVMDKDKNRNLALQKDEVQEILAGIFRLNFSEQSQACERVMNYSNAVSYEEFMRNAILFYLCELDPKKNINNFEIKQNDFLTNIERVLHFVNVRPANHILKACFQDVDRDRDGIISKNQYIGMLRNIFENYVFDRRGLPIKTRPY